MNPTTRAGDDDRRLVRSGVDRQRQASSSLSREGSTDGAEMPVNPTSASRPGNILGFFSGKNKNSRHDRIVQVYVGT